MESDFISFGRILRPQGNKGEVRIKMETESAEDFLAFLGKRLHLAGPVDMRPRPVTVEDTWPHKGFMIVKFRGIDDMGAAESLRGAELQIPREDRPPSSEGEYYHDQLISLEVRDASGGRFIGNVSDVMTLADNILLEIEKGGGKTFLVPFVNACIRSIDLDKRVIRVSLPEGLENLNEVGQGAGDGE
ncbi:MAG: ribosome maturation factor RimM [Candidatus Sumerlaeota bacterium]|nr:ribosome maturation factor RimM [Candidatus Sumerlaeota bacterium]